MKTIENILRGIMFFSTYPWNALQWDD